MGTLVEEDKGATRGKKRGGHPKLRARNISSPRGGYHEKVMVLFIWRGDKKGEWSERGWKSRPLLRESCPIEKTGEGKIDQRKNILCWGPKIVWG